jgi:hypothetical protein
MQKKRPARLVMNPDQHPCILDWHNVPEEEFFLYARAFRAAAKTMALAVELAPGPPKFAACPVVFMYRHALELHLKALILGDGGNFLVTKPDRLSVYKTHSVSWLSQFVCQIVTTLNWQREFRCEGIETLADFKTFVEDVNSVDPGPYSFRYPVGTEALGFRRKQFNIQCPGIRTEDGRTPGTFGFHRRRAGGNVGYPRRSGGSGRRTLRGKRHRADDSIKDGRS